MDSILIVSNNAEVVAKLKNSQLSVKLYYADNKEAAILTLKTCFVRAIVICHNNTIEAQELIEYFQRNLPHVPIILFNQQIALSIKYQLPYIDQHQMPLFDTFILNTIDHYDLNDAFRRKQDFSYPVNIIAHSPIMQLTMSKLERTYTNTHTVMLCGPKGSGLSTLAHFIHYHTNRKYYRYYTIDCCKITNKDQLIEQLIGHLDKHNGPMFLGLGGTLVLENIDQLDINAQNTLQQILSKIPHNIDLKIISTASNNLQYKIDQGQFKYQLYEKLSTFFVSIPPLKDRKEDIIPLIKFFVQPYNPEITPDQIATLESSPWHGNVSELKHSAKHMISHNASKLNTQYLSPLIDQFETLWDKSDLNTVKLYHIRQYLRYLIRKYNGNQTKAAEHAGVDRSTFYRNLQDNASQKQSSNGNLAGKKRKYDEIS